MSSIISSHNKSLLNPVTPMTQLCNCSVKSNCPLNNQCLTPRVIYQAEIKNNCDDECKTYIGLAGNTFKERFYGHVKSFKHRKYSKETELSKYIWELKDENKQPLVTWKVLKKINNRLNSKQCILCLSEKYYIIKNIDDVNMLNKRSEFISKCRHFNKQMLSWRFDSKD